MRRAVVVCGVLAVLAFGASAVPVFGADSGSVNAQVTVQQAPAACITVPTTTVDFGTRPFNPPGNSNTSSAAPITVTGCATGGNGQRLLARGTNAIGADASWELTTAPVCVADGAQVFRTNRFNLWLSGGPSGTVQLAATDSVVRPQMGPVEEFSASPTITMPCEGSSGAGQTMSMSYIFTATLA